MKNDSFIRLIIKYAILLIITQIVNYVWFYFHFQIGGESMLKYSFLDESMWITIETITRKAILLLFAILIYFDLKKNNIRNLLLPIITFIFGYIGIYLSLILLIYVIHKNQIEKMNASRQQNV